MKQKWPTILVVTFTTTKSEPQYRDLSVSLASLKNSVTAQGLDFISYNIQQLNALTSHSPNRFYLKYRKGVGAWFWKPIIIQDAMNKFPHDFILYLDSDCRLIKNPLLAISNLNFKENIAAFRQNEKIVDWSSKRLIKHFYNENLDLSTYDMWTAGILLVKNNIYSKNNLETWSKAMENPVLLLEPIFGRDSKIHRHDQSILSILIARDQIPVYDLGRGFYSEGLETTTLSKEFAWVETGSNKDESLQPRLSKHTLITRILRRLDYQYHQLYKFKYWFLYRPFQLMQLKYNRKI
jgi:hypothetical protein